MSQWVIKRGDDYYAGGAFTQTKRQAQAMKFPTLAEAKANLFPGEKVVRLVPKTWKLVGAQWEITGIFSKEVDALRYAVEHGLKCSVVQVPR